MLSDTALIISILLLGVFAYLYVDLFRTEPRLPRATKIRQSLLLVIVAVLLGISIRGSVLGLLIALGMAAGFVGDLFMHGYLPQGTDEPFVLGGMAAFGAGHILYIAAFFVLRGMLDLGGSEGGAYIPPHSLLPALIIGALLGLVPWFAIVRPTQTQPPIMRYAALGYAIVIGVMGALAVDLFTLRPELWMTALGGILFVISDAVLAYRIFAGQRFENMDALIWVAYSLGQAFIVLTSAVAPSLLFEF